MVMRSRFSTTTVADSNYLLPWLAAEGISEVQGFGCEVEFIPATESEP
jgi:hypothetical protein